MDIKWKNGDECAFDDRTGIFIGLSKNNRLAIVEIDNEAINHDIDLVRVCDLSKPETPNQREERERLEAAYHLYSIAMIANEDEPKSFEHFSKHNYKSAWIAVAIKTNYQKAK